MKFFGILVALFHSLLVFGQDQPNSFSITFSTFNHADRIFDGVTTYALTPSSIKVTKIYFGDTIATTLYSKKIRKGRSLAARLSQIDMDSLKQYYDNYCILPVSGDEYFLDFTCNLTTKSIRLHHYYLKELDDIIDLINSNLPRKYRFRYLTEHEKQDCELSSLINK